MNIIEIERPVITDSRIEYQYRIEGDWIEAFTLDEAFYIEYSCDISEVPSGIAIVPLLCNILPMAWVYDAKVIVPVCDRDFYESIPEFKKGYIDMYPMMSFGGEIEVGELQEFVPPRQNGAAAFFSGGVDAFNTLINHRDEKPTLITLWGSDVFLDDHTGWERVRKHLEQTSRLFETDYVAIKSSFRQFLNEGALYRRVMQSGDGWWHGFQHGIGLIGHAAPLAYALGKKTVYIASSFTAAEKGKITCASDPTIDNYVRFFGVNVVHDGYEFTRQDKIHNITQFSMQSGVKIPLRVCWESKGGSNCCNCEKCWRTILGIYAERCDPKDYGFEYESLNNLALIIKTNRKKLDVFDGAMYRPIQTKLKENYDKQSVVKNLRWFYDVEIEKLGERSLAEKCIAKTRSLAGKIRRKMKKGLHIGTY